MHLKLPRRRGTNLGGLWGRKQSLLFTLELLSSLLPTPTSGLRGVIFDLDTELEYAYAWGNFQNPRGRDEEDALYEGLWGSERGGTG